MTLHTLSDFLSGDMDEMLTALFDVKTNPTFFLVVAYAVRRLPYMVRSAVAGLQQTSVALEECPLCICDVNSDAAITADDTLRMLRFLVRLPETLDGPFEPLWRSRVQGSRHYASPVAHDGLDKLWVIDAKEGKRLWTAECPNPRNMVGTVLSATRMSSAGLKYLM